MNKRIAITIKPTNACNMRCKHCYHAEEGYASIMMKPELATKMLEVAIREYDEIHVVFHGGEPTLWGIENFQKVIDRQKKFCNDNSSLVIKNSIQTNGLLLNQEWVDFLKQNTFSVGLSFDGPHNVDLRTHTQQVYNNMQLLKKNKLDFGVLCVETAQSIKNLMATYNWFKENGINFKILALFMCGTAKEHTELELNIDEYVSALVELYKYWLFDKDCNISARTCEDLLKVSDKLYCIQYGGSCIHNRICLNPNGDLYPCGRPYTDDFILGNIKDLEFVSQAFNTAPYRRLADISAQRVQQCMEKCKFFGVCKGGCVSSAILEGSFEKIDNTTCVRAKKLLSAITEINQEIYGAFDAQKHLDKINAKALEIMQKVRSGYYEYTHVR